MELISGGKVLETLVGGKLTLRSLPTRGSLIHIIVWATFSTGCHVYLRYRVRKKSWPSIPFCRLFRVACSSTIRVNKEYGYTYSGRLRRRRTQRSHEGEVESRWIRKDLISGILVYSSTLLSTLHRYQFSRKRENGGRLSVAEAGQAVNLRGQVTTLETSRLTTPDIDDDRVSNGGKFVVTSWWRGYRISCDRGKLPGLSISPAVRLSLTHRQVRSRGPSPTIDSHDSIPIIGVHLSGTVARLKEKRLSIQLEFRASPGELIANSKLMERPTRWLAISISDIPEIDGAYPRKTAKQWSRGGDMILLS